MSELKLAVFDIDGTLVDSREVIHRAMTRAFDRAGLGEISYDKVRMIVGLELGEAVAQLAPADYPAERVPELANFYKQAFVEMRAQDGFSEPLYAGAKETVERSPMKAGFWAWRRARRGAGSTSCSSITTCTDTSRPSRPWMAGRASPIRAWCWMR